MGCTSEWEDLLSPYTDRNTDRTPAMCGMAPTLYVNVPPSAIRAVIAKHGGMTVESDRLPQMVEVDERGYLWADAAPVPSDLSMTDDTDNMDVDPVVPTSVVQLGAPPPLPPPTPPTRGALTPPVRLRETTMSPITNTHDEDDEGDDE